MEWQLFYVYYCSNAYKFYVPVLYISVLLVQFLTMVHKVVLNWSSYCEAGINLGAYPSFILFTTHTPLTFIYNWSTPLGLAVEMQLPHLENYQNHGTAELHLSPCIGRSSQRALLLKLTPSILSMTDDIWRDGKFHNLLIQHMSSY